MTHHVTPEGMAKPVRELTPVQLRAHINELGDCASVSSADASRYVALMTEMERRLNEHAALESQLTAARRSVAELRAWVEAKTRTIQRIKERNPVGQRDYWHGYLGALQDFGDRLTAPSPAAPADDAKPEAGRSAPC